MWGRRVVGVVVVVASVLAWDVAGAGEARVPAGPPAPSVRTRPPAIDRRPPVLIAVETEERVVALSFDDGPDPRWTPALLDALASTGAKATFFVTGTQVRAHPDLLHRIVGEGHEVANHTDTHPRLEGIEPAVVAREVTVTSEAIGAAGVPQAPWFRPPKGRYDEAALEGVARTGLETVGWTVCVERWLRRGRALGLAETLARVRPGGIVVGHDGGIPDRSTTVEAVPDLLRGLDEQGYEVVTVSDLLRRGAPIHGRPGELVPWWAAPAQPAGGVASAGSSIQMATA